MEKLNRRPRTPARLRKPGRREHVASRQAQAIALRKAGATFEQIAAKTGVSVQQSWRDVQRVMKAVITRTFADAEAHRTLELERLDVLQLAQWPRARDGDVQAATVCLRISERRSKLLGLDAPVRSELSGTGGKPIEVAAVDLSRLSDQELYARLHASVATIAEERGLPNPCEPGAPAPVEPAYDAAVAYAAALERRAAGQP